MKNLLQIINEIKPILTYLIKNGTTPYLVGGVVRDLVLKKEIKDIDIEVHGISIEKLEAILQKFGHVRLVGKSFGVLRIDGYDIDWSLPRVDSIGRKPKVIINPDMKIEDALRRRDITMNAMAINLKEFLSLSKKINLNKGIIDPFGGLKDIKEKKLRYVDKKFFIQDPLRFFRVMQFIGRFEMQPDKKLNFLCKKISFKDLNSDKNIAKERIFDEIKKLLLKSKSPSLGFRWLQKIDRLKELFPEIYELINVKQKIYYHPEGDVFEHTMQSMDAAANLNLYENDDEKFLIVLTALCHDFGKPSTTDENFSAKGHELAGVPISKKFLKRITNNKTLIDSVCKLVLYHTRIIDLIRPETKLSAYKRLALKLAPNLNLTHIGLIFLSDIRGRNANSSKPLKRAFVKHEDIKLYDNVIFNKFLIKVKKAQVEKGPQAQILKGRDLLNYVKPGPEMGRILKYAYKIQIDKNVKDIKELKEIVFKKFKIKKAA